MIIDEKVWPHPPPSYASVSASEPFPSSSSPHPTLSTLPAHILLQIVYMTFTAFHHSQERQRKTLYWLATSLRLVNRPLYIACMHVLRSTYLPAYSSLIHPPYSSDPFPLFQPSYSQSHHQSPLHTLQRETTTLDLFIALKVREDVWADDTALHLEREESFRDLFDLAQPRARLEDLVRAYGLQEGVVVLPGHTPSSVDTFRSITTTPPQRVVTPHDTAKLQPESSTASSSPPTRYPPQSPSATSSFFSPLSLFSKSRSKPSPSPSPSPSTSSIHLAPHQPPLIPLPAHLLSVSFSPRKVGLLLSQPSALTPSTSTSASSPALLNGAYCYASPSSGGGVGTGAQTGGQKRTIVEVPRAREESLEVAAQRLVRELERWLRQEGRAGQQV